MELEHLFTHNYYKKNSSETRMTAKTRSKHINGSKERYLLGQNTTCKFLGYPPLSSDKTTQTTVQR